MYIHVLLLKLTNKTLLPFFLLLLFCLPLSAELGAAVFIDFGFVLIEGLEFVADLLTLLFEERNGTGISGCFPSLTSFKYVRTVFSSASTSVIHVKQKLRQD